MGRQFFERPYFREFRGDSMSPSFSVVHLTSSFFKKAGGVQTSIIGLTNHLYLQGVQEELWSFQNKLSTPETEGFRCGYRLFRGIPFPLFPISFDLYKSIGHSPASLLHLHGLWQFPSIAANNWVKLKPKIITPHGFLDSWALQNSAWKKKTALFFYEWKNLRGCHCFHALCKSEAESIRALGLRQPIAIIPNGVDLPVLYPQRETSVNKKRTLLYLGRFHKKKNLLSLINAWNALPKSLAENWRLRLVGWGDKKYKEELSVITGPNVDLAGPFYGIEKEKAFREADAFILPSLSEGLPMAILEAWSFGLPVLMSKECNLPEGFEADAALETGTGRDAIIQSLRRFLTMDETERIRLGRLGRKLVEEKFTWPIVASKMATVYQWLLGQEKKPDWVIE
jgi:glycosyltransferase involved in cell wall biosynthesis